MPIPNRWGDISRSSTNLGPNGLHWGAQVSPNSWPHICVRQGKPPSGPMCKHPCNTNLDPWAHLALQARISIFRRPPWASVQPDLASTVPLRPHMCLCVKHKHIWPKQTHAHSESTIFCTNPISGAIHGALRGVVHAACNACACKQANEHHAMHISCTCTHPTIRCASAVRVLRSS